jgi:hypothetical protein
MEAFLSAVAENKKLPNPPGTGAPQNILAIPLQSF